MWKSRSANRNMNRRRVFAVPFQASVMTSPVMRIGDHFARHSGDHYRRCGDVRLRHGSLDAAANRNMRVRVKVVVTWGGLCWKKQLRQAESQQAGAERLQKSRTRKKLGGFQRHILLQELKSAKIGLF